MFVDAVTKITSGLNRFDKSKYHFAVCDQKGHTFDTCPVLKKSNIPQLYLKLLLVGKRIVCDLHHLDPVGNKYNNDLNVVHQVSLAELDDLEILENSPIHTVSSIIVSPEEQLTEVVNLLCDSVTPLLSSNDDVITYLALVIASVSRRCIHSCPFYQQQYQQ